MEKVCEIDSLVPGEVIDSAVPLVLRLSVLSAILSIATPIALLNLLMLSSVWDSSGPALRRIRHITVYGTELSDNDIYGVTCLFTCQDINMIAANHGQFFFFQNNIIN